MRTRTKICGITRPEDALAAVRLGADAIGLVFYAPSPRSVTIPQARTIVGALPPFVHVVGLFVDATAESVCSVLSEVHIDLLQFHGDEKAEFCDQFAVPYIKALRVKPELNLLQCEIDFSSASGLLLDAYQEGVAGGTGKTFDWALIPKRLSKPVILAGGLTAENVAEAILSVRPYAVDVSGGVEQQKGIKDAAKIAAFMRGVRNGQV